MQVQMHNQTKELTICGRPRTDGAISAKFSMPGIVWGLHQE